MEGHSLKRTWPGPLCAGIQPHGGQSPSSRAHSKQESWAELADSVPASRRERRGLEGQEAEPIRRTTPES